MYLHVFDVVVFKHTLLEFFVQVFPLSLSAIFLLTAHAAIGPLFMWIVFDLAYCVHKWRSVNFCGILFDQVV